MGSRQTAKKILKDKRRWVGRQMYSIYVLSQRLREPIWPIQIGHDFPCVKLGRVFDYILRQYIMPRIIGKRISFHRTINYDWEEHDRSNQIVYSHKTLKQKQAQLCYLIQCFKTLEKIKDVPIEDEAAHTFFVDGQ